MNPTPVIAIFDIGKTNKKLFLFNTEYDIVYESAIQFAEIADEDGFPCEDVNQLQSFIVNSLTLVIREKKFTIKAVNFAGYGASLIHIDEKGNTLTPLYNYLKPYPEDLKQLFYRMYGGEEKISLETASPVLGNLNSGMQLFRLKRKQPAIFQEIKYSLHLPQYLSYLITNKIVSDITSIGCHTQLWNFQSNHYHDWVVKEDLVHKLPALADTSHYMKAHIHSDQFYSGIGMHDSSAALVPYLIQLKEPFLLISTGTWSISLNPFSESPLTIDELRNDCLCYLSYKGEPIKAARLFSGFVHEKQAERIAAHFDQQPDRYKTILFDRKYALQPYDHRLPFPDVDLKKFDSYEHAYHHLVLYLATQQYLSSQLILTNSKVKRIFVDGGFSKNEVYMNFLASMFPEMKVFAAEMSQATALGAAILIHAAWNEEVIPKNIIKLQLYTSGNDITA